MVNWGDWLVSGLEMAVKVALALVQWAVILTIAGCVLWRFFTPVFRFIAWLLTPGIWIMAWIRRRFLGADLYRWRLQGNPQTVATALLSISEQIAHFGKAYTEKELRFSLAVTRPWFTTWTATTRADEAMMTYQELVKEWVSLVKPGESVESELVITVEVLPCRSALKRVFRLGRKRVEPRRDLAAGHLQG